MVDSLPPLFQPDPPSDFAALPSEQRNQILVGGQVITQFVFRRAAAICIGAPPSRGNAIRNGSAFLIQQDGHHYLGTAWHVVEYWFRIKKCVPDLLFQVGDVSIDPAASLAWKDVSADLAFLRLTSEEAAAIPVSVCEATAGWPPPKPKAGDYVLISGFPSVIRQRSGAKGILFNALSTRLQVTTVRDDRAVCQFLREHWVAYDTRGVPPPGTDLGGMSGGPVLLIRNLDYPLVGVVDQFSQDYELLYFRLLATVPSTF